jgi:hypothetical protein
MDRIIHSSAVDIGGGRRGFRSKDTVAGLAGTVVTATHMNATQEEMVAIIEKAGLAPSAGDLLQLVKAIRSQRLNFVAAAQVAGTANAVTLAFTPEFTATADLVGVPLVSIAEADNTGAMTVKVDALPAIARTWPDGTALAAGEVKNGQLLVERYDGTAFRLFSLSPAAIFRLLTRMYSPPLLTGSFAMTGVASGVNTNISGIVQSDNTLQDSTMSAGGLFTTGVKDAGIWSVAMRSGTGNGGDEVVAELLKNGGTFGVASVYTLAGGPGANAVGTIRLASTDTVQVRTRQINSGSATRNMTGTFSFTRIGA